jgi:hypothetical protein
MTLRLEPSVALRERRLERLLAERGLAPDDARLAGLVEDALLVGSLALAGAQVSWDEARGSRREQAGPEALVALRRARRAVEPQAALSVEALKTWHEAIAGPVGFRRSERPPDGAHHAAGAGRPAAAPPAFIESRLAALAEWLDAPGSAELTPEQKAALALARIVEIRPFDDANGRVSRLAADHLLRRAGLRPPILVAGDEARLRAALQAAFRLETGPLVDLVREASRRALDVMIQSLERRLV